MPIDPQRSKEIVANVYRTLRGSPHAANVNLDATTVLALSEAARGELLPEQAKSLLSERRQRWSGGDPESFAIAVSSGARTDLLDARFWNELEQTGFTHWGRMTQRSLIEALI